ncbi:MAG: hypothetical protein Q4G24_10560 [Paracoccus sp. (in: a-proteobacteria)]|uniref:hypothetical protein n=1 Tax=Paracoccus sp. TaxID=267 RepID=UPI0026DF08BA|nr:hypothetical protein [Paracoccus sp. (in: a-proteobacteria)]MDO5621899.1 hypothetical protein [Paracoccus sp. (in: a-proteobacteria)]
MRLTTKAVAAMAAVITAPAAAVAAASIPALADQALAWVVTAVATVVVSALSAVVAKITGVALDRAARDTLQVTMENAARVGLRWMLTAAADTPIGRRIDLAIEQMLAYADQGAGDALRRFGMDSVGDARGHLREMAESKLIEAIERAAPGDLAALADGDALSGALAEALRRAGL